MILLLAAGVGMGASSGIVVGPGPEGDHVCTPRTVGFMREHMRLHGPGAAYPVILLLLNFLYHYV